MGDDDLDNPFPDPVEIEITDVFDLHTIPPRESGGRGIPASGP
jgi:hypothetical protein